jgi:hypothetical protein
MEKPWLVAIVGPIAVGKMTVGQSLRELTGFELFHNHMVIDLLTPFFEFGSEPFDRLATSMREQLFEEAAASGLGMIATWGWFFESSEDKALVQRAIDPFERQGGRVSFVELAAPLEVRLERNRTENRRANKRVEWATDEVVASFGESHAINTSAEVPFPWPERHLKIENSELAAKVVARQIQKHFGLPGRES